MQALPTIPILLSTRPQLRPHASYVAAHPPAAERRRRAGVTCLAGVTQPQSCDVAQLLCARRTYHSRSRLSPPLAAVAAGSVGPVAQLLPYDVRQAVTAAELRAAAYLRAVCFYKYPEGRSEFAARSHRRMKADAEWDAVTAKVEGRDLAYQGLAVTCYVAAVADDDAVHPALLPRLRAELDASSKLPADTAHGVQCPQLVIGSLDLNIGGTLPAEELIGKLPQDDPQRRRAYLSNVCVAASARRCGVAKALMLHAEGAARNQGVEHLYVHVVADNLPALELYRHGCGYEVEAQESENTARLLQRPRRFLLVKRL